MQGQKANYKATVSPLGLQFMIAWLCMTVIMAILHETVKHGYCPLPPPPQVKDKMESCEALVFGYICPYKNWLTHYVLYSGGSSVLVFCFLGCRSPQWSYITVSRTYRREFIFPSRASILLCK